jgi:hypothetical protein
LNTTWRLCPSEHGNCQLIMMFRVTFSFVIPVQRDEARPAPGRVVSHPCGSPVDPCTKSILKPRPKESAIFTFRYCLLVITEKEVRVSQGNLTFAPLYSIRNRQVSPPDTVYSPSDTLYRYSEREMSCFSVWRVPWKRLFQTVHWPWYTCSPNSLTSSAAILLSVHGKKCLLKC